MAAKRRSTNDRTPLLEWVAGSIGLVLTVITMGVIGDEAYRGTNAGPDLQVEVAEVTPAARGATVRVVVRNGGRRAALGVMVEGTSGAVSSQAEIDYVAAMSTGEARLMFPEVAEPRSLSVRVVGYTTP